MRRYVELHATGFGSERHELVGEALVLGTGSDAVIRVDRRSALRPRHLDLTVVENGVSVALAPGVDRRFVFQGAERTAAFVPWDEELFLDNIRLTFLEAAEAERASPVLLGFAPIALLVIGFSIFKTVGREVPSARIVEAPVLFDEHVTCSERDVQVAEHRAREAERAAQGKAERFAFVFRDGVQAGHLFQESRACFEALGLASDVARLNEESRRWIGRVNEEYAVTRLRLRVALDHHRYPEALAATKALRALLSDHQSGPYAEWLADLERELAQSGPAPGSSRAEEIRQRIAGAGRWGSTDQMTRLVAAFLVLALVLTGCGAEERRAIAPQGTLQEQAEDLFRAGQSAAARGDTVRAEQYLSAAVGHGYDRGKALPLLLGVCLSSSRLRAALSHAEPYLRDHPDDDALRYIVAIVYMGLGNMDQARLELAELLRHDQENADAHLLLGILDVRTDAASARDHFRTYLALAPQGKHAGEARSRLAELAVRDTERARETDEETQP